MDSFETNADELEQEIRAQIDGILADFSRRGLKIADQDSLDQSIKYLIEAIYEKFQDRFKRISGYTLYKNIFLNVLRAKQDEFLARDNFTWVLRDIKNIRDVLDATQNYYDAIQAFFERYQRTDHAEVIEYAIQLRALLAVRDKINVTNNTREVTLKEVNPPDIIGDEFNYARTLKLINNAGKDMERYTEFSQNLTEGQLRYHILSIIASHYRGHASIAEAVNKHGKTDILIRKGNSTVFIAELKFWKGQKEFRKAISQLLRYVTRDETNTAMIVFVKQGQFKAILGKAFAGAKSHPNFLSDLNNSAGNWFNFQFRPDKDKASSITMAIQFFHLT